MGLYNFKVIDYHISNQTYIFKLVDEKDENKYKFLYIPINKFPALLMMNHVLLSRENDFNAELMDYLTTAINDTLNEFSNTEILLLSNALSEKGAYIKKFGVAKRDLSIRAKLETSKSLEKISPTYLQEQSLFERVLTEVSSIMIPTINMFTETEYYGDVLFSDTMFRTDFYGILNSTKLGVIDREFGSVMLDQHQLKDEFDRFSNLTVSNPLYRNNELVSAIGTTFEHLLDNDRETEFKVIQSPFLEDRVGGISTLGSFELVNYRYVTMELNTGGLLESTRLGELEWIQHSTRYDNFMATCNKSYSLHANKNTTLLPYLNLRRDSELSGDLTGLKGVKRIDELVGELGKLEGATRETLNFSDILQLRSFELENDFELTFNVVFDRIKNVYNEIIINLDTEQSRLIDLIMASGLNRMSELGTQFHGMMDIDSSGNKEIKMGGLRYSKGTEKDATALGTRPTTRDIEFKSDILDTNELNRLYNEDRVTNIEFDFGNKEKSAWGQNLIDFNSELGIYGFLVGTVEGIRGYDDKLVTLMLDKEWDIETSADISYGLTVGWGTDRFSKIIGANVVDSENNILKFENIVSINDSSRVVTVLSVLEVGSEADAVLNSIKKLYRDFNLNVQLINNLRFNKGNSARAALLGLDDVIRDTWFKSTNLSVQGTKSWKEDLEMIQLNSSDRDIIHEGKNTFIQSIDNVIDSRDTYLMSKLVYGKDGTERLIHVSTVLDLFKPKKQLLKSFLDEATRDSQELIKDWLNLGERKPEIIIDINSELSIGFKDNKLDFYKDFLTTSYRATGLKLDKGATIDLSTRERGVDSEIDVSPEVISGERIVTLNLDKQFEVDFDKEAEVSVETTLQFDKNSDVELKALLQLDIGMEADMNTDYTGKGLLHDYTNIIEEGMDVEEWDNSYGEPEDYNPNDPFNPYYPWAEEKDDLDLIQEQEWDNVGGDWEFDKENLDISTSGDGILLSSIPGRDFKFGFDVSVGNSPECRTGFIFNYKDEHNYYKFTISSGSVPFLLVQVINGMERVVATPIESYFLDGGSTHKIDVSLIGDNLIIHTDGRLQYDLILEVL